jgi:hypothetical protein
MHSVYNLCCFELCVCLAQWSESFRCVMLTLTARQQTNQANDDMRATKAFEGRLRAVMEIDLACICGAICNRCAIDAAYFV